MAELVALVDTSLLIDYFRKGKKERSKLYHLHALDYTLSISAVTEFEVYTGASMDQLDFWEELLRNIKVIPFATEEARMASKIAAYLRSRRQQIAIPDLFIGCTAVVHDIPMATLNMQHFERIPDLRFVDLPS